jgi:ribose transport system permease protein
MTTELRTEPAAPLAAPIEHKRAFGLPMSRLADIAILAVLALLFAYLSIASDAFLTPINLLNILDQWAPVGIMACASTLVLIAGGFDLSVGAAYALSGVVAATIAQSGHVVLGLVAGIAVGLLVGLANGVIVNAARVNPFMATLASSLIVRGAATALSGGVIVVVTAASFPTLGRGELFDISYATYIWIGVAVALGFVLNKTTFGSAIYAVGGNATAARMSGIRVGLVRGMTYVLSGVSAGLAGVIAVSLAGSGQAGVGVGMELSVIAAVVVGGTSIRGGEGAVWRSVIGVLIIALIGNGFNLLGVPAIYQSMAQGAIILLAVALDSFTRRGTRES